MNMRSILTAGVMLLSLSGLAQAAETSAALYRLDLVISRDGELIGKPAMVVEAGAQAEVSVDGAGKPDDAFRILVTASPVEGTVGNKESVKIDLSFFDKSEDKWVQRAEHSVTTVLGEPLSLAFPSKPGETAEKNYDLVVLTSHGKPGAPAAK